MKLHRALLLVVAVTFLIGGNSAAAPANTLSKEAAEKLAKWFTEHPGFSTRAEKAAVVKNAAEELHLDARDIAVWQEEEWSAAGRELREDAAARSQRIDDAAGRDAEEIATAEEVDAVCVGELKGAIKGAACACLKEEIKLGRALAEDEVNQKIETALSGALKSCIRKQAGVRSPPSSPFSRGLKAGRTVKALIEDLRTLPELRRKLARLVAYRLCG